MASTSSKTAAGIGSWAFRAVTSSSDPKKANLDYVHHPSRPPRDVLLLARKAFTNLVDLIRLRIARYGMVELWRRHIEGLEESEKGADAVDVGEAEAYRIETQALPDKAEKAMEALGAFLNQVKKDWNKLDKRILRHILRSPVIALGVGEHPFTVDWEIFQVNCAKFGDGSQGNKMDLSGAL